MFFDYMNFFKFTHYFTLLSPYPNSKLFSFAKSVFNNDSTKLFTSSKQKSFFNIQKYFHDFCWSIQQVQDNDWNHLSLLLTTLSSPLLLSHNYTNLWLIFYDLLTILCFYIIWIYVLSFCNLRVKKGLTFFLLLFFFALII